MTDRSRRQQDDDRAFSTVDLNAPSHDTPSQQCRDLAAAVIEQARADLRGQWRGRSLYPSEQAEREQAVREARDFLTGATPAWRAILEEWCEILDLDVAAVIADAKAGCPEGPRPVSRRVRKGQKTHVEGDSRPEPPSARLMPCPASPAGS